MNSCGMLNPHNWMETLHLCWSTFLHKYGTALRLQSWKAATIPAFKGFAVLAALTAVSSCLCGFWLIVGGTGIAVLAGPVNFVGIKISADPLSLMLFHLHFQCLVPGPLQCIHFAAGNRNLTNKDSVGKKNAAFHCTMGKIYAVYVEAHTAKSHSELWSFHLETSKSPFPANFAKLRLKAQFNDTGSRRVVASKWGKQLVVSEENNW